jgi:hypothetical protein
MMSKMGNFVMAMQEDVTWMSKETFVKEYGYMGNSYWEEVYGPEVKTANESHALMMLEHMEMVTGRF